MVLRQSFALLVLAVSLAGCSSYLSSNSLQIDDDGAGRFSGLYGSDWTEAEVRGSVATQVCGGVSPGSFSARMLDGSHIFSGTC